MLTELGHIPITARKLAIDTAKNGDFARAAIEENGIIITFDRHFLTLKREVGRKIRAIFIEIHPRDPILACDLLSRKLNNCIAILRHPGVIILRPESIESKRY